MANPTKCPCGGKYKKVTAVLGPPRDGSKYFQCYTCWNVLEITAEHYQFIDKGPEPRSLVEKRKKEERAAERVRDQYKLWPTGPSVRRFS